MSPCVFCPWGSCPRPQLILWENKRLINLCMIDYFILINLQHPHSLQIFIFMRLKILSKILILIRWIRLKHDVLLIWLHFQHACFIIIVFCVWFLGTVCHSLDYDNNKINISPIEKKYIIDPFTRHGNRSSLRRIYFHFLSNWME